MARDYWINGPTMVQVKGQAGSAIAAPVFLGLSSDQIKISPRFNHFDVRTDDFGPNVPAELLFNLVDVFIDFTLVHFDENILEECIIQSMAGKQPGQPKFGTLQGAGTTMGKNQPLYSQGNSYISLSLFSKSNDPTGTAIPPWTFLATCLYEQPLMYPLGVERSLVHCHWRAIPYKYYAANTMNPGAQDIQSQEITSINTVVWNRSILQ